MLTHVVAAAVIGPGLLMLVLSDLGVSPGGEWWDADDADWLMTLAVIVLTVGAMAALVEALLVRFLPWRWPARVIGAVVVLVAALLASFPMTFSLTGAGPVEYTSLTLYVVGFALLVVGQLALTLLFGALLGVRRHAVASEAT